MPSTTKRRPRKDGLTGKEKRWIWSNMDRLPPSLLASKLKVHRSTVFRIGRKLCVAGRRKVPEHRRKLTVADLAWIRKNGKRLSTYRMAARLEVNQSTVWRALNKLCS